MIHGTKDVQLTIGLTLAEGEVNQYPQIKIYDEADNLDATVNLVHIADAYYNGTWTPNTTEYHYANAIIYTDAGHTVESTTYGRRGSIIKIDEVETDVTAILLDTGTTLPATLTTMEGKIDTVDGIVDTITADVKRVLGLSHENIYIDNTSYDAYGNLSSARLRIYSVAGSVGTGSDVVATYTITCNGSAPGRFTNWKQVKA